MDSWMEDIMKIILKYFLPKDFEPTQRRIGLRSAPDTARALATGAKFIFMGRSFMYGVAALGNEGGKHIISLLKTELQQIMEQLCCVKVEDFPNHLISKSL